MLKLGKLGILIILLTAFTSSSDYMDVHGVYSGENNSGNLLNILGSLESSNDHTKVNKFGYIGKYQFGEKVLVELGYYEKDKTAKNDWSGTWTGKDGIYSKEDFLNSERVQEKAARALVRTNWSFAKKRGMDRYVGRTLHGVRVTKDGILAVMHLKGLGGMIEFVSSGTSKDGFGTDAKEYMAIFSSQKNMAQYL